MFVRPRPLEMCFRGGGALLGLADRLDHDRILALNALEAGEVQLAMAWLKNGPLHPMDRPPSDPESLREALDRPLLVAGMVRYEGEPGGGPFWVRDDQGKLRAQVVESAEMNMADPCHPRLCGPCHPLQSCGFGVRHSRCQWTALSSA